MLNRREWLRLSLSGAAITLTARSVSALPILPRLAPTKITVYKSALCGCCKSWVERMTSAGFVVDAHDVEDDKLPGIKDTFGIPQALRSCHVAMANGYVFEGHVPPDLVTKVLTQKPKLAGLAVPGMPAGSPGMEMGSRKDRYDVIAFAKTGRTWVYASR